MHHRSDHHSLSLDTSYASRSLSLISSGWSIYSGSIRLQLRSNQAIARLVLIARRLALIDQAGNQSRSKTHANLRLYVCADLYFLIASDSGIPHICHRLIKLMDTYGRTSGSATISNQWIQLMLAHLDNAIPCTINQTS